MHTLERIKTTKCLVTGGVCSLGGLKGLQKFADIYTWTSTQHQDRNGSSQFSISRNNWNIHLAIGNDISHNIKWPDDEIQLRIFEVNYESILVIHQRKYSIHSNIWNGISIYFQLIQVNYFEPFWLKYEKYCEIQNYIWCYVSVSKNFTHFKIPLVRPLPIKKFLLDGNNSK